MKSARLDSDGREVFSAREVRDAENLLAMIPIRRDVRYGYSGGKVEFEIPRFRNRIGQWFVGLLGRSTAISITLDEVGTFIWNRIDGSRSVEAIGKDLYVKFGDKVNPLYPRLAGFLQSLEKNGFIRYRRARTSRSRS